MTPLIIIKLQIRNDGTMEHDRQTLTGVANPKRQDAYPLGLSFHGFFVFFLFIKSMTSLSKSDK